MFINTGKGIRKPTDLIGKRSASNRSTSPPTLWMRGILSTNTACRTSRSNGVAEIDEDIEFTPPKDLKLTRLPDDKSIETMLAEGELDAVLESRPDQADRRQGPRVARLFPDYKNEETAISASTGIFPIMHVMGIRQESSSAIRGCRSTSSSPSRTPRPIAMKRMENPRIVPLAWYRETWEEQEDNSGLRPVGLWPRRTKPQKSRSLGRLLARAGPDFAEAATRRTVPRCIARA